METPHHVCTCAPKLEAGPEESSVSHDKPCSEKQEGAVVTLKGPQTLTLLPYTLCQSGPGQCSPTKCETQTEPGVSKHEMPWVGPRRKLAWRKSQSPMSRLMLPQECHTIQ